MASEEMEREMGKGEPVHLGHLWGSMKRSAIFNMSFHLGLAGWISWHHWSHAGSAVFWTLGVFFLFGWAFAKWDK
ncbi:MAG: hypothetical protein ACRD1Z_20015 [Vicinamibacteria bacterium]